jgi:hypothetical protein
MWGITRHVPSQGSSIKLKLPCHCRRWLLDILHCLRRRYLMPLTAFGLRHPKSSTETSCLTSPSISPALQRPHDDYKAVRPRCTSLPIRRWVKARAIADTVSRIPGAIGTSDVYIFEGREKFWDTVHLLLWTLTQPNKSNPWISISFKNTEYYKINCISCISCPKLITSMKYNILHQVILLK